MALGRLLGALLALCYWNTPVAGAFKFQLAWPEQDFEQTVELLIIWDAMTLLLSHCNIWLAVSRSNAMIKLKTKCIVPMHISIPSQTVKDYSWCGCYRTMESSAGWSKQNEKVLILANSNDLSYGFLTECGLTIIHTVQQQHYTIYTKGITDFAHENVLWVEFLWV